MPTCTPTPLAHVRLCLALIFAMLPLAAQTVPTSPLVPGLILVAQLDGEASQTVDGKLRPLVVSGEVFPAATIFTAADSSVVLVFSNGATLKLGATTEIVIEEYIQDRTGVNFPLPRVEASPSRTRIRLNQGAILGRVPKLKIPRSFIIETGKSTSGFDDTAFRVEKRSMGEIGLGFGDQK